MIASNRKGGRVNDGLVPVGCLDHAEALAHEDVREHRAHVGDILDEQDDLALGAFAARCALGCSHAVEAAAPGPGT